jgi:hypothetical protein
LTTNVDAGPRTRHLAPIDWALAASLTLYLGMPLALLALCGWDVVFSFLAADAFYYLTVAANVRDHAVIAFDQVHPSNCSHPAWQAVVTALRLPAWSVTAHVHTIFLASLAAGALALVALWRAIRRTQPTFPALLVFLPIGVFGLVADRSFHTWWAYANGLETGLLLAAYACLVALMLKQGAATPSPTGAVHMGLLLTCVVAARLDSVFLVLAVFTVGTIRAAATGRLAAAKPFLVATVLPLAAIVIYASVCRWYFGAWLPTSGAAKTSWPAINAENLTFVIATLTGGRPHPAAYFWTAQLVVPLVAAVGLLLYEWRRLSAAGADRYSLFLSTSGLYVLFLHVHNLLFVAINHQGFWYYAVSTTYLSLATYVLLERRGRTWPRGAIRAVNATIIAAALGGAFTVFDAYAFGSRPYAFASAVQADVFSARDQIRQAIRADRPLVYAIDDGLFAFATGIPAISGMGLCLDTAGHVASMNGRLPEYIQSRGVTHVFVPRNYLPFLGTVPKGPHVDYRTLPAISAEEVAAFAGAYAWIGHLRVALINKAYVLFEVAPTAPLATE